MNNLQAPDSYWRLDEQNRKKILNKCGPDGPLNSFIPNHLLGLDISESCNIHDFTFMKAKSKAEHLESDDLFLKNMRTTINNKSDSSFISSLRRLKALV